MNKNLKWPCEGIHRDKSINDNNNNNSYNNSNSSTHNDDKNNNNNNNNNNVNNKSNKLDVIYAGIRAPRTVVS